MRGMTLDKLHSPRSSRFFALQVISGFSGLGASGFSYRIFFIFESSQLNDFSMDLQNSGL